ncbi:hypothetical protein M9458_049061, partial [Cirrhinus mrigala]
IDLNRPVRLPDLEHQRSMEELSRLVLGVHEEAQSGPQAQDTPSEAVEAAPPKGAECSDSAPPAGAEDMEPEAAACSAASEPHPFVLPLGVMARNEVYPRTCKMW